MKALMFSNHIQLENIDPPRPEKHEALVKIELAGICNTDLELFKGYMDFKGVPGHEFVGRVMECAHSDMIGARVVGEINLGCGHCGWCAGGMERHCPGRSVLGILGRQGVFAEFVTLPVKNLHRVPDTVSDEAAVFTEPLAAACEILEQVHIQPKSRIAVIGDGKLGQLIAQVLDLSGCSLTVLGKSGRKCARLKNLGIYACMDESFDNSRNFDIVVEASGSISGFNRAFGLAKPRGMIILKSTTHEAARFHTASLVIDEISMIGSRCGRFEPALRLLEQKRISVEDMIDAVYTLEEWQEAFQTAENPETFKVVFSMPKR